MLHLAPALRVKDVTIFDLVDQAFYDGEFIFFSRLAARLSKIAAIPAEDGQEIGVLSELMYLSSKIHFLLAEQPTGQQELCDRLQMPVLLGDLLYGRFLVALTEAEKSAVLPVYITYLRQFNGRQVQALEDDGAFFVRLLSRTTADAVAFLAGMDAAGRAQLELVAENYYTEHWAPLQSVQITDLEGLEEALQQEVL